MVYSYSDKQKYLFKYKLSNLPTKSELIFKELLDNLDIRYLYQKGFLSKTKTFYICDFYIPKPFKLVIEIDGLYHLSNDQQVKDQEKDKYLKERRGLRILRFTNEQVLNDLDQVKNTLLGILNAANETPVSKRGMNAGGTS